MFSYTFQICFDFSGYSNPLHFKLEAGVRLMNREIVPFANLLLREPPHEP